MARPALSLLLLVLVTALTACGSTARKDEAIAQRLQQPGSTWERLSAEEQQEALSTCRLGEAVALARDDGATSAPYYSSRYAEVLAVPGEQLHDGVSDRFADEAHRTESIAQGCTAVLAGLVDVPALRAAAQADFASPVTPSRGALRVTVDGDATRLRARVSPVGAHLQLAPSPGRAPTTATWTIRERDGVAEIDLRAIPHGTSYLEVRVGPWRETLVIRRAPARRLPAPRTFAPIVLHGQGAVGLPLLYVPRPAWVTADLGGAPLTLASSRTLLLALGVGDGSSPVPLPAGRYHDVQVRTPGAWSIRIVPQA